MENMNSTVLSAFSTFLFSSYFMWVFICPSFGKKIDVCYWQFSCTEIQNFWCFLFPLCSHKFWFKIVQNVFSFLVIQMINHWLYFTFGNEQYPKGYFTIFKVIVIWKFKISSLGKWNLKCIQDDISDCYVNANHRLQTKTSTWICHFNSLVIKHHFQSFSD